MEFGKQDDTTARDNLLRTCFVADLLRGSYGETGMDFGLNAPLQKDM